MESADKTKKRALKIWNIVLYILFGTYLVFLGWRVFFYAYGNYHRVVSSTINYNLVPFRTIDDYFASYGKIAFSEWFFNLFGNIIAFIPFGFFVITLFGRKLNYLKIILLGIIFSALIEILQLIFHVGCLDVDDIILNVVGVAIGVVIFKIIGFICIIHFYENR